MKKHFLLAAMVFTLVACSDSALVAPSLEAEVFESSESASGPSARFAATSNAQYDSFFDVFTDLEVDFAKFYEKGNKAAGTRVRKGMQDLKKQAKSTRVDIQKTLGGGAPAPGNNGGRSRGDRLDDNPYTDVLDLIVSMEDDFIKFFDKGNRAAGIRLVRGLKALEDAAQDIRVEIQTAR